MTDLAISLDEQADLELDSVDIGVEGDVIAFEVSGRIRGAGDALAGLEGTSLTPTEIRFEVG